MMNRLWPLVAMLIPFAALYPLSVLGAGAPPRETSEIHFAGFSPNNRMEVKVVTWYGENGEKGGMVKIIDVKSHRSISSFPYDGQVPVSSADCEALWRSDSRCFALVYPSAKDFVTTALYALSGTKWVQIPLPEIQKELDRIIPAVGEERVITGWHGFLRRDGGIQWLPGDRFRLRGGYQNSRDANPDDEKGFWVTCRVVDAVAKSKPRIVVENAELKPDLVSVSTGANGKKETVGHFSRGISPDDRTEVTALARPDQEGGVDFKLRFQDVESGRVLGTFPFGWATFAQPSYENFAFTFDNDQCTWRSDSRYVALTYAMTRGFSGTTFYGLWHHRWVEIPLPETYKAAGKLGKEAGEKRVVFGSSSHGYQHFWQWLPNNRFRLRTGYGDIQSATEEAYMEFWVTCRIIEGTLLSKPKVVLEKVEFAPEPVLDEHNLRR